MVACMGILAAVTAEEKEEERRNTNQEGIRRMNESKSFDPADLPYNNRRRNGELPKSSGRNIAEEITQGG